MTEHGPDAVLATELFAIGFLDLGGIRAKGPTGPQRDSLLAYLRKILPSAACMRRVPVSVAESRLLGGLDLASTLRTGRPVAERGILAEADGGVLILPMAERVSPTTAAHLAAAMDRGTVQLERDGLSSQIETRFGIVALDEGVEDEQMPDGLLDRLAFQIDLAQFDVAAVAEDARVDAIAAARNRLPDICIDDHAIATLCKVAMQIGVRSLRGSLFAIRAARAAAALAGRSAVVEEDVALAARLVLAPRATILPAPQQDETTSPQEPAPADLAPNANESGDADPETNENQPAPAAAALEDRVLEAAQAAIPENLLARLKLTGPINMSAKSMGTAGILKQSGRLGRPIGVRAGALRDGVKLNVIETLRASAPWQALRRREQASTRQPLSPIPAGRVDVRPDDFRITRFKQRTETTTIFAVDASGSSALNRLAEVKGAVELLLADCYLRRDQVALIAFRGRSAELILSPTRSLVRAKRGLAELPGGGGTPLASALDTAGALAGAIQRKGQTPILIFMTDGQANIAGDGTQGRERAMQDALAAARRLRSADLTVLLIDTSPRARQPAAQLAKEMGAEYIPLPYADSLTLSKTVRAKSRGVAGSR